MSARYQACLDFEPGNDIPVAPPPLHSEAYIIRNPWPTRTTRSNTLSKRTAPCSSRLIPRACIDLDAIMQVNNNNNNNNNRRKHTEMSEERSVPQSPPLQPQRAPQPSQPSTTPTRRRQDAGGAKHPLRQVQPEPQPPEQQPPPAHGPEAARRPNRGRNDKHLLRRRCVEAESSVSALKNRVEVVECMLRECEHELQAARASAEFHKGIATSWREFACELSGSFIKP